MQFFFMKTCLENVLEFECMHENKIFFFFKGEINLKVFRFFRKIFKRKPDILIPNIYLSV
jgi:hypothetical protein